MDEYKVIFIGAETVTVTWIRQDQDGFFVKKPGFFGGKWIRLIHNADELLKDCYEERTIFSPIHGRLPDDRGRVYFFDLDTLKPYFARLNTTAIRQHESEKEKSAYLADQVVDLNSYKQFGGINDLMRAQIFEEYRFYDKKFKPGSSFNTDKKSEDKK